MEIILCSTLKYMMPLFVFIRSKHLGVIICPINKLSFDEFGNNIYCIIGRIFNNFKMYIVTKTRRNRCFKKKMCLVYGCNNKIVLLTIKIIKNVLSTIKVKTKKKTY